MQAGAVSESLTIKMQIMPCCRLLQAAAVAALSLPAPAVPQQHGPLQPGALAGLRQSQQGKSRLSLLPVITPSLVPLLPRATSARQPNTVLAAVSVRRVQFLELLQANLSAMQGMKPKCSVMYCMHIFAHLLVASVELMRLYGGMYRAPVVHPVCAGAMSLLCCRPLRISL